MGPFDKGASEKTPESPVKDEDGQEAPVKDEEQVQETPESPLNVTAVDDSFEASSDEETPTNPPAGKSSSKSRHRKHLIFGLVVLVLIAGAVLGIVFGTGVAGGSSNKTSTNAIDDTSEGDASGGDEVQLKAMTPERINRKRLLRPSRVSFCPS